MIPTELQRPLVVVLDVNETLSDMSPLAARFEQVGAPAHVRATWFAGVLRDGFALTVARGQAEFATLARVGLRSLLASLDGLVVDPTEAADFVLAGLAELPLHPDVHPGLERMHAAGVRLVTLSNGSAETAAALLERGGAAGFVEQRRRLRRLAAGSPRPSRTRTPPSAAGFDRSR